MKKEFFYDEIAGDFDSIMNMYDTNRRIGVIFEDFLVVDDLSGKSLLDAGCGTGWLTKKAIEKGAKVTSVDISSKLVDITLKKNPKTTPVISSILDLPFDSNSFDYVISSDVIEHTPDPYEATIELIRVLKPGGKLCITVPNRSFWYFSLIFARLFKLRKYQGFENWVRFNSFRNFLSNNGITILSYKGIHLYPFVVPCLNSMLYKLDKKFENALGNFMVNIAAYGVKQNNGPNWLTSFPKNRCPVLKESIEIYSTIYKSNRKGQTKASSLSQKMESWMHRQVAKDCLKKSDKTTTLEIGAGTLNQLRYEMPFAIYDIVEPNKGFYEDSPEINKVRNIYDDISKVPIRHKYDRITSVATFEHICNLPEVLAYCGFLLAPNGVLRIAIPSEGTFLWALGWKLTTGLECRIKYGLDYGELIRNEHVNTAKEIEQLLNYFFKEVECKVLGISKNFSFYQFFLCKSPRVDRCHNILSK